MRFSEEAFDVGENTGWACWRGVVVDNVAIAVKEEFGKVPRDRACLFFGLIVQGAVSSEESVHFVRVVAVDVDLFEHGECDSVGVLSVRFDFFVCAWLLLAELIAREGKDFKTVLLVFLVNLN